MLLQLDLIDSPIFERPFDDICLWAGSLDLLALGQCAPKFVKIWQLDQVPDIARVSLDDGGLADRS